MRDPLTDAAPCLIALDWGTSSLRAYLLGVGGGVIASRHAPLGIMQVAGGDFAGALDQIAGPWLARWPGLPMLAAGMIGSAQGWVEARYLPCPAGPDDLARQLVAVPGHPLWIVPGVVQTVPAANVMRGEETQIAGALALRPDLGAGAVILLPGTHSKWVRVEAGRIARFSTWMTGELFAVLKGHSILGRFARDGAPAPDPAAAEAAFRAGLEAGSGGRLSQLLFSARARVLTGQMAAGESLDYLSGLLIGEEMTAALARYGPDCGTDEIVLIGDPTLCARYRQALAHAGRAGVSELQEATVAGLWRIAGAAGIVSNIERTC